MNRVLPLSTASASSIIVFVCTVSYIYKRWIVDCDLLLHLTYLPFISFYGWHGGEYFLKFDRYSKEQLY